MFKAHRLGSPLNSRLESDKEEEEVPCLIITTSARREASGAAETALAPALLAHCHHPHREVPYLTQNVIRVVLQNSIPT